MVEVVSENRELKGQLANMGTIVEELNRANRRVDELKSLLDNFENFFGVLYINLPDVFAREMTLDQKMTNLNSFIGNRKAELMEIRGSLPRAPANPTDHPVDEDLLGTAMRQLSSENANLKFRLDNVETHMAEPAADRVAAGAFNGGGIDDDTAERLERLERLVALQLAPQLDEDDDETTVQRVSPDGDATSTKKFALSESDTEILRDELNSVRSISSK